MRSRDKRGRFTKAKAEVKVVDENYEENSGDEERDYGYERRRGGKRGIFIRIPFYEFIPFFCVIFVLLVMNIPWLLMIKPLSTKLIKTMARLLYVSVQAQMRQPGEQQGGSKDGLD